MLSTIKSELIRIKRPSFIYGGWGIMIGFSALISFIVFDSATGEAGRGGPGLQFASLNELQSAGGFVATSTNASGFASAQAYDATGATGGGVIALGTSSGRGHRALDRRGHPVRRRGDMKLVHAAASGAGALSSPMRAR